MNDFIVSVECKDHSGFAEKGFDIVCAGISAIVQTAILGLSEVAKQKFKLNRDENKGYLKLELIDYDLKSANFSKAQVILKTMQCGISDLQKGYFKYINLEVNNNVY